MATKQEENNMVDLAKPVHQQLNQYRVQQIQAVLTLLDEGNTVPFIARYRKERTGTLDEVAIRDIEDEAHRLMKLNQRRDDVLKLIQEQGKLTPSLKQQLEQLQFCNKLKICIFHINRNAVPKLP